MKFPFKIYRHKDVDLLRSKLACTLEELNRTIGTVVDMDIQIEDLKSKLSSQIIVHLERLDPIHSNTTVIDHMYRDSDEYIDMIKREVELDLKLSIPTVIKHEIEDDRLRSTIKLDLPLKTVDAEYMITRF